MPTPKWLDASCPHRLVGLSTWSPVSGLLWKTVKPLVVLLKKMSHLNFYGLVLLLSTLRLLTVTQCDKAACAPARMPSPSQKA